MNEDDPVVEELPVYLSHSLSKNLFIFQYPTVPAFVNNDNEVITKCCVKPEHQEVLLEMALDTQSPNYDISHGEQIALNVDGNKNKDKYFQSSMMDKTSLISTRMLLDTGTIAVAAVQDKKFIISPVKGVISLQPGFPHLDITDKRAKEEAKEHGDDVSGGEEEEESKQVTVKFARQDNERLKRARERSYDYLSKKSAEEKWFHTQYHNPTTRIAEIERSKFKTVELEDRLSTMCLTPQQYMDNLIPSQQDLSWTMPNLPSHVTSLTALRNLPLAEIVQAVMKEVKVMTFQQLSTLLTGHGDIIKLLRCVQQAAVLVQGNWVVRSDVIYSKDSVSQHNGVPGEVMCRARDYILYLLSDGQMVERKKIAATVKLPPEELKEILSQVAKLKLNKGWVLRLPKDEEFLNRFPEIAQRHSLAWEAKYKQLKEAFETSCPASPTKHHSRRRESSMSGGSDLESPVRYKSQQINPRRRKNSSVSSDTETIVESQRQKRNNESINDGKKKNGSFEENIHRKKQNSESSQENTKINKSISKNFKRTKQSKMNLDQISLPDT
uniref:DNA-directed RNA polymerase III subunit RPC5 n=1 Tax=Clastoptera arizonana TaxID=38151 RepID=A0A1B6DQ29_9HEMI